MSIDGEKPELIETVEALGELKIEIWDVDFQHALEGHPEVTLERIQKALKSPVKIVESKHSKRSCLFYNLELKDDPIFGDIYFCVVVAVLKEGSGKMETAYETTYVKKGKVLFETGGKK